jgi:hypothetical protein
MSTTRRTANKTGHPIIYHSDLTEDDPRTDKMLNPYYITNFENYEKMNYQHPIYKVVGEKFKEVSIPFEVPDMDTVPHILAAPNSVYSIINEIHLTQGPGINPHITIVFKDKSKCAYYFHNPVPNFFQINNNDGTTLTTPAEHKLSDWFINLGINDSSKTDRERMLAASVKIWLLSMLQNYLMTFELMGPKDASKYFPQGTSLVKPGEHYPHMRVQDYPKPEEGFHPPTWTDNWTKRPLPHFDFNQSATASSATAKAKGLNKKTRRKPSRRKPSRRKPSRRK